jgi:hypothetical protein
MGRNAPAPLAVGQRRRLLGLLRLALPLALVVVSCRVYRKDPEPREQQGTTSAGEPAPVSTAAGAKAAGSGPQGPALPSESLSLWVLNRPEADLVVRGAEAVDGSRASGLESASLPVAMVVLGLGPSHACAQSFAERALRYVEQGNDALQSVSMLLDEVRRWRWSHAKASLHAAVRGSDGTFGAVQSVAPATFSSAMLIHAVSRHAVINGKNPRWERAELAAVAHASSDRPAVTNGCGTAEEAELAGPVGVLLRTANGGFLAALADLESPGDAGVISILTQYEMSIAAGPMGAVVVLSNCSTLPGSVAAAKIYAAIKEPPREAPPAEVGCRYGYARLADGGAQVGGAAPLAWASAVGNPAPPPEAPHSGAPATMSDAGAASPATVITP